jgi:hypothetical protein
VIGVLHVLSQHCLFLCIHVSPSLERVIAAKLVGFQITKKFLYCMEPELSLPYTILKKKTLKSGKSGFKNFNMVLRI